MDSPYENLEGVRKRVDEGQHRGVIGGLWDQIGALQFDVLVKAGLQPGHRLVDVGCGSLRGGVHFIRYLEPGHYFGTDINQSLIDAGRARELTPDEATRVGDASFCVSDSFAFDFGDTRFDFAIAVSLFTHLSQNKVELCLRRLRPHMAPGGVFYATVFECPDPEIFTGYRQTEKIATYPHKDPFHYQRAQVATMAARTGWDVEWIGDFGHPRGQKLVRFAVPAPGGAAGQGTRALPPDAAAGLRAGAEHYRAYVGPAAQWDFMGATQFRLLTALGLRESHSLLDFGCGSLRAGRLLMAYLLPGLYHGIEPNAWLIEDAITRELGRDFIALRQPRFDHNDSFDMGVFGRRFDFIVAQSIFSHSGPDLVARALESARQALAEDGLMLATFVHRADIPGAPLEQEGWRYPGNISYRPARIQELIAGAGLSGRVLPWFHPRQTWYVLAHDPARLPDRALNRFLRGTVLRDDRFAESGQGGS